MKLVLAILGSGAVITVSAMTSDILGQPLSEAALMHMEDELEGAVGKVDRNRSPLFNDLSKMINDTMSPSILTAHTSAQTQLDGFRTAFEACIEPDVSTDSSGVTSTAISDKLEEHRQCRQREEAARTGAVECDQKLSTNQIVKQSSCDSVPGSDGTLPPLDNDGHVGCKVTPGDYEGWLNSFGSQIKSLKDQYDEAKGGCGNASQLVDELMPKCLAANQSIAQNKTACDAIQAQADQMACLSDPSAAAACGAYTSCYDTAKKNYLDANESIAAAQVNRTVQWRVLKRMQCLLTEESAGASHEGIDACREATVDTSHLDLVYPDVPAKVDCTIDKGLEDHPLPCSGDWINLYGQLPATSPAAPCTPCPLCSDVEPAEGLVYKIRAKGPDSYGWTNPAAMTMHEGRVQLVGQSGNAPSSLPQGLWRVTPVTRITNANGIPYPPAFVKNPHLIESVTEPGRFLTYVTLPEVAAQYSMVLCGTAEQLQGITSKDLNCDLSIDGKTYKGWRHSIVDINLVPDDPPGKNRLKNKYNIKFISGILAAYMKPTGGIAATGYNTNAGANYNHWEFEPVFDPSKGYLIQSTKTNYAGASVYWDTKTVGQPGPVMKMGRTLTDGFSQFKFLPPPAGFIGTTYDSSKKRTLQYLMQDAFSSRSFKAKSTNYFTQVLFTTEEVTWNIQMSGLGTFDLQPASNSHRATSMPDVGNPTVGGESGTPVFVADTASSRPYSHWFIKEARCVPKGSKPQCDEGISTVDKGASYRGCQAVTKSGRTCQAWDAQSPQKHTRTASKYPRSGLTGNFCRNPDKSKTIWCYTTDPKVRYESCEPMA